MRFMRLAIKGVIAILLLAVVAVGILGAWLWFATPALIRVGSAYTAKIVCSNVYLAGRDPMAVLAEDVQAPGHVLLTVMRVSVDREARTVTAGLFGIFGVRTAVARDGVGCTVVPEGSSVADLATVPPPPPEPELHEDREWPAGSLVRYVRNRPLDAILDDPAMTGPGMRATIVVRGGRIAGERYGKGFEATTPLLGWSMAKTINAAILGTLVAEGKMTLDKDQLLPAWEGDSRHSIKLSELLAMRSGLSFNEAYGEVTDVTRMLFLERDMAGFAAAQPMAEPASKAFSYSSGTAMILSKLWVEAAGSDGLTLPHARLFGPVGMTSATMEVDASGTPVGSSYIYANARDWARFAQLLLQNGVWNGRAVLPADYVRWMRQAPEEGASYANGQTWLCGPDSTPEKDQAAGIPADAFWMIGHDGQTIAIIPSQRLIVVRMGLTPSKLNYRPQALVAAVSKLFAAN